MNEPSAKRAAAIERAAHVRVAAQLRVTGRDWQSGEHHLDLVSTPGTDTLAAAGLRQVAHGTLTAITAHRFRQLTDAAHAWVREHDARYDGLRLIIVMLDPDGPAGLALANAAGMARLAGPVPAGTSARPSLSFGTGGFR